MCLFTFNVRFFYFKRIYFLFVKKMKICKNNLVFRNFLIMIIKIVLIYFLLINIITFVVRWVDKRRAIKKKWRISEKTLLILTLLWWIVWAVFWMQVFHHKTIKSKFLIYFRSAVAVWFIILWILFYFYLKS